MVHSTNATWRRSGIRDTVIVMGVLLGLLALQFVVPFQPAQIPGYFLLVGFFPVEAVVAGADSGVVFYALFGGYVLVLSLAGGVAATVFRNRTRNSELASWRFGVAGGLAVTGAIALLFSVNTLLSGAESTPAFVGLVTALVLFGLTAISATL
ncbi:hypothetical protein [Halobacterium sp. CBA1126]|uniref:hypothetical protein n=1 Tax=Halobacterium sp. CBA1126 TaxID=2668074 RepID=UPI0012FCE954|nr:hypothetical protein [Halobacterium sp. CBA1126]